MPHARQTRPPSARPIWQSTRHPYPKRPRRLATGLLDLINKYAPKGH